MAVADQYPLFSGADEALWQLADSFSRMGDRFEDKTAAAYARIVKDYPLSDHADEATSKLQAMNRPVPQADPVAYARMKYELENRDKAGMFSHMMGMFKHNPDTRAAAKSGTPAMAANRPTIPVSVPSAAASTAVGAGTTDVSVQTVTDSTALDTKPDARQNPPAAGAAGASSGDGTAGKAEADKPAQAVAAQPLPYNHTPPGKKKKIKKKADTTKTDAPKSDAPTSDAPKSDAQQ